MMFSRLFIILIFVTSLNCFASEVEKVEFNQEYVLSEGGNKQFTIEAKNIFPSLIKVHQSGDVFLEITWKVYL